ncbi:[FeFe] hydrogenase H-cluster maturation GTPase HydF [Clostridium acidisoli DSM 12555]|uniref:[FeFe] hydrogenase H-cluster maturation GTPase HydF n=1 Tax=Clostridium acidisoli DSM 12555 TaxID=1121291 RepID=A0A1W1XC27_9CLOT|nr:[FeFe] hydrogenase H-cluster maturation GTPase HydF [Clostridium acidisoli]SMC21437.1 [FeFe] hydrogenase H-cluster maturation GTPase HydF [Clostridium acidisoli DSM 12555]
MSSLNETPMSNRIHIALFGKTNVGKSSIINALTNQDISLVSKVKGTTTDPVYKAMELLPLGAVVFIDTAGLDDETELGDLRKKKTLDVLNKTDVALIIIDSNEGLTDFDLEIATRIKEKKIPIIGVLNKIDLVNLEEDEILDFEKKLGFKLIRVSVKNNIGIKEIKENLIKSCPNEEDKFKIVGDLISPGDFVILVTPIDKAAPKGRLILPQQQVIRDVLESDAISIVTKEYELRETLQNLNKKPNLVITDSQAFLKVAADTPKDIPLTSFSILLARYKGDLSELVRGAFAIKKLKDGDKVLIAEACTHHRQSDDIGKVKIPRWLRQMTGKDLQFEFSSGFSFPENLKDYALIVHCAGCMLNRRAMLHRISEAIDAEIPIVNYGVLIAYVQGILERTLAPFPAARLELEEE